MQAKLIIVGGFLGAGKTTLLKNTAELLRKRGEKVGIITNDQATGLVDTAILFKAADTITEVSGSCFCCNFGGFENALKDVLGNGAQIVLAEPVGSCTDLSATIMQPMKDKNKDIVKLLPFTVLVDPARLVSILQGENSGLHNSAAYIIDKQLEEADIILINKEDTLSEEKMKRLVARTAAHYPDRPVLAISATNGKGIEEWLETLKKIRKAGSRLAVVDYNIYAEGEAVLGWLNMEVELKKKGSDWNIFGEQLINKIYNELGKAGTPVAHVKIYLSSDSSAQIANLSGGKDTLSIRGKAGSADTAICIINARVQTMPEEVLKMVRNALESVCGADEIEFIIEQENCLMPGRPKPTWRYEEIIAI